MDKIVPCIIDKVHKGHLSPLTENDNYIVSWTTELPGKLHADDETKEDQVNFRKQLSTLIEKSTSFKDSAKQGLLREILKLQGQVSNEHIGSGKYQFDGQVRKLSVASPLTVFSRVILTIAAQGYDEPRAECVQWWSVEPYFSCTGKLEFRLASERRVLNATWWAVQKEEEEGSFLKRVKKWGEQKWADMTSEEENEFLRERFEQAKRDTETWNEELKKYTAREKNAIMTRMRPKLCLHMKENCSDQKTQKTYRSKFLR